MRTIPPVFSPISTGALIEAAWAGLRGDVEAAGRLSNRLGRDYPGRTVTLVDSGTSALFAALRAIAAQRGTTERVLTALPAYACPDLGAAVVAIGGQVVLYDLDPYTLEPELESIEACLREGARAVVAVHFFGRPLDLAPILALAAAHGATVIEDAAQHAGATLHGHRVGAQAPLGVLSFGRGKGLNGGGGGALVAATALPDTLPAMHASGRAQPLRAVAVSVAVAAATEYLSHPAVYGAPARVPWLGLGETRYHDAHDPVPLDAARATLVTRALLDEPAQLTGRRERAHWYDQQLADRPDVHLRPVQTPGVSGALRHPVRLAPQYFSSNREQFRSLGVVRVYPRTLDAYPEIARVLLGGRSRSCPGAALLAAELVTLPTHGYVRRHDQEAVVSLLRESPRRDAPSTSR